MKFDWTLSPLQRKREWELDLARGRLGALLRSREQAAGILGELEEDRADQEAAALASMQRHADPVAHRQALAYLAGVDARLARARAHWRQLETEVVAAREACKRCGQGLEVLARLREQHLAQFRHAAQREAAKEADSAWTARAAGGQGR